MWSTATQVTCLSLVQLVEVEEDVQAPVLPESSYFLCSALEGG